MNVRDVPKPERVARLPVDERGYPIFFTIQPPAGRPLNFRALNLERHERAGREGLCMVCGEPLDYWLYFIGGPMCLANRIFGDGAMHKECAEYSLQVCPHLNTASARYASERGVNEDPTLVGDPNVIKQRPSRLLVVRVRSYRLVSNGSGKVVFRIPDPSGIEWLTNDGKPLSDAESKQTFVICEGAGQVLCLYCRKLQSLDKGTDRCTHCRRPHVAADVVDRVHRLV